MASEQQPVHLVTSAMDVQRHIVGLAVTQHL